MIFSIHWKQSYLHLTRFRMASKSAQQLLDDLIGEVEISVSDKTLVGVDSNKADNDKGKGNSKAAKSAGEKKPKTEKPAKPSKAATAADEPISVNSIDLRVGKIVSVQKHETADKLYCEMIDVGEEEPRAIASGLVPHYTLEEMQDRRIVVICNLVPRKLVGFKSHGMVLCAAKKDEATGAEKVEFVDPPADAAIGERLVGDGLKIHDPLSAKQCDKKKAFEQVAADLRVNAEGVAMWKDLNLVAAESRGISSTPTIRDAVLR